MMGLNIEIKHFLNKETVALVAPYHPDIVNAMRALNGSFDRVNGYWLVDEDDENTLRELAKDVFGTDDFASSEKATVRLTFKKTISEEHGSIFLGGREIAKASGRDSGAKLGEKVVLIDGKLPSSGGSVKNWKTVIFENSVLDLRKLPLDAAKKMIATENDIYSAEIVNEKKISFSDLEIKKKALEEELEQVQKAIDAMTK